MPSSLPTLVVHGYLAPAVTNLPVHRALRQRGLRTFDVPIPGLNTQDIAASSALVGETARRVMDETGADKVDLVGVSMGGLIAVHYVRCQGGHEWVRRTVALGSPLSGTAAAAVVSRLPGLGTRAARQMAPGSSIVQAVQRAPWPEADIVSVYARGDGMVDASAASLPGARLVRAPVGSFPLAHYQLVVDPTNLAFLADLLGE